MIPRKRALSVLMSAGWLLILSLTGCATLKDPEASQEQTRFVVGTLEGGHTLAQSFVSRRGRLNGIWLWLNVTQGKRAPSGDAKLIIQLYHTPGETTPLATVTRTLRSLPGTNPIQFDFPAQADPPGQIYYLTLLATAGRVDVFGINEDVYSPGTAYQDGATIQGDIAFRTSYDYNLSALLGDIGVSLGQIWLAFPLAVLLLLPGWLIYRGFSDRSLEQRTDGGERLAIALGLSMTSIPVLMLWTTLTGLPWSRLGVLFGAGLMVAIALWVLQSKRSWAWRPDWFELGLLVIFIGALAVRLIMVRDLAAPAWVDSVHHSLITRLILEQGGYPDNYLPYLDIASARYHPGFHSLLASFQWLSGAESLQAMLVFGQVLNALSVFAVYLLAKALTGDRLASLIAALIAGFFTPMPAYYASWGRYTQLAGLLIMPAAFVLVRDAASAWVKHSYTWKTFLPAVIACAGLFLVHYRVIAFMACLLLADFTVRLFEKTLEVLKTFRVSSWLHEITPNPIREVVAIVIVAVGSLFILLPWLPSTLASLIVPLARSWQGASVPFFAGFAWTFLTTAWGKYALYLAGLGMVWSLIKKPRLALTIVLWVVLLFILANSAAFGWFPSFINNTSVEIALFMPIATLGGFFASQIIGQVSKWVPVRITKLYATGLITTGFVVAYLAARQLLPILNPVTFLFRQADKPALAWIEEHVPRDETILINPFNWGYGLYAGNDGGFWIAPLTGIKTLPPPVLYGMDTNPQRIRSINQLSQQVIDNSQDAEALHSLLEQNGIRYIYIGARGGVLSARALKNNPLFALLYQGEGTWVFQVK
jgi:Family of unknown function (DUF6541)